MRETAQVAYSGNPGSVAFNVIGTVRLSVINGHWRNAHINAVRGDAIDPPSLDMQEPVSEDTVRRTI